MRILFTSHYALPHLGGIEFVVDALARRLAARGHEVAHIAADTLPHGDAPYRVVRVPAWNVAERRFALPYPLFAPRLLRVVREELARADVVHAHGMLYLDSVAALLAGARCGRVLTEHVGHVRYEGALTNAAEWAAIATLGRAAARAADAIIVLNRNVERQLRRLAPHATIVQIANGVDVERFRPPLPGERERLRAELGWDDRPRALFVGRLVEKKGVRLAAAAASSGAFELVLVGPGDVAPAPHVECLGPQEPQRVAELYRAADVFLLPSTGEGFPLTAQEAMASGLPVVLGDDSAYGPILAGSCGAATLVEREPAAIAGAVGRVLEDARRRGEEALRFARSRFDWSATIDRHVELYERAVSAARARAR